PLISFSILSIILILTIAPGAILNGLILATILRAETLQTPSNIFLCNLAISDLTVCLVAQPLALAWKWSERGQASYAIMCPLTLATWLISSQFSGVSLMTVTAASIDRYLALYLHLMYTSSVTSKRVAMVCAFAWFASTLNAFSSFAGLTTFNALCSVFLPLCVVTIAFTYFKIFK
ncbi:predicted protein, partial [Nematostella vectensis]